MTVRVAATWRTRIRGLAFRRVPPPYGLLFPRCRSIHTFGMRFALDVFFLDAEGRVLRAELAVPPGRVLICRAADAVLELPA